MTNLDMELSNLNTSSPKKEFSVYLLIISISLILMLLVNVFQVANTYQQNKLAEERALAYQERVEEAQQLVNRQQNIIMGLMSDYEDSAYGPNVDRIAEQQLIATEFTLSALQILAIQNSQIIELLASAP